MFQFHFISFHFISGSSSSCFSEDDSKIHLAYIVYQLFMQLRLSREFDIFYTIIYIYIYIRFYKNVVSFYDTLLGYRGYANVRVPSNMQAYRI